MSHIELSEQELFRRESLDQIRAMGIEPYPAKEFEVNTTAKEIHENYSQEKNNFQNVQLAGRLMARRIMGSASFAEIQDHTGRVQIYVKRDNLCPGEDNSYYNIFFKKLLDIGDIIGLKGKVFVTQMGETSIEVTELVILTKSLRPLPVVKQKEGKVFDAFSDAEQRYRQRYVDVFVKRTRLMNSMREYLNSFGYLEVETPVLQPLYGGAAARPFKTKHHALDQTLYLRIANELYLKRLIVGGYEGVYEFSKDFRNEGMSRFHNPEFTQVELYVAYKDYNWMMDLVEEMIEKVSMDMHGTTKVQVGDHEIDFKRPWKRYTMYEAIKEYTGIDISAMDEPRIFEMAKKLNTEVDETMGKGKLIDEIFGETVEPNLIQPTFITDYPIEMSPLAKKHREKEGLVERFEAICNGKEICNAFSELNDPIDQRERFEEQLRLGKRGDEDGGTVDEAFLTALEHGMPPAGGLGIGIDRLAMIMTNQPSIQDVLFFPQMRQEKKKVIDQPEQYISMGIPAEWVPPLQKMGYNTVKKLKEVKPGKLHNEMGGYNKKNKLGLQNPSLEEVKSWLEA